MTDLCRASTEELSYDDEQTRLSELHEEHQRAAETAIGNLDDLDPVIDGIENAQDAETIELLKAIRMRDTQKIGEVVLRMLKAELVAAMRD